MSSNENDFVMDLVTVASFIGSNVFAEKVPVIFELKMDLKGKRWYVFVANGKQYMHDYMIELFELPPTEAIHKWREVVATANNWGWESCLEAYVRMPFQDESLKLEINDIQWFFEPLDTEPEVVKINQWINNVFSNNEIKGGENPSECTIVDGGTTRH